MHDIDRTQAEYASDLSGLESGYQEADFEFQSGEGPIAEVDEMELAGELLEISDEAELDQFLGKLFGKVAKGARGFLRSSTGKALGGILKGAAKAALPIAGGALGTFVGGPIGASLGSSLASQAGSMFGLELEGLSPEDQEFEVARQFVRFAADAAQKAAAQPGQNSSPQAAATTAAVAAARQFAPGLLRNGATGQNTGTRHAAGGQSGRWIRRGRKIVLLGV
jgi:hypothetical protein